MNNEISNPIMDRVSCTSKPSDCTRRMRGIIDATPLSLNLWNHKFENLMCNKASIDLFDLKDEEEYLGNFISLSPVYQPDGKKSCEKVISLLQTAFANRQCRFQWLHCNLKGEEIPCEIILVKMDVQDENGQDLVVSFTRDLRTQLATYNTPVTDIELYFYNSVSDKTLLYTLAKISNEILFSFDIRTSCIQYYGALINSFDTQPVMQHFPVDIICSGFVFEEDIPLLEKLSNLIRNGIVQSMEIRLLINGVVRWFRINYDIIFNGDKVPILAVGRGMDIQHEVELSTKSKIDLLTQCYNKISSEHMINDIINSNKKDGHHTLFIIDIDNFKTINDNFGHYFGDVVLTDVARNLKQCFRGTDVVGRLGGDEFIVFVENLVGEDTVIEKAKKIIDAFTCTYPSANGDFTTSCSVGISQFPTDGDTMQSLYKSADKSLYQSKKEGKNRYTFYSENLMAGEFITPTLQESNSRLAKNLVDTTILTTIFNLLYESSDIGTAINAVLNFIGNYLRADRCYILEPIDNGTSYANTYEWCGRKVKSIQSSSQNIPFLQLKSYIDHINEEGINYCSDVFGVADTKNYIMALEQGVTAFMQSHIHENNMSTYIFGVDIYSGTRIWTEKEINSMSIIVKTICVFINNSIAKTLLVN